MCLFDYASIVPVKFTDVSHKVSCTERFITGCKDSNTDRGRFEVSLCTWTFFFFLILADKSAAF